MTSTSENSEDIPVSVSERRAVLVNNAPQSVIDGIGDVRRVIREKAIKTLTAPLDLGSIADIEVFYSLPLEFLAQGDLPGAIWYMQTIGKLGQNISLEVLEQVVGEAIRERKQYLISEDEEYPSSDNKKAARYISSSINHLFRMTQENAYIQNDSRLHIIIGNYYKAIERPYDAMLFYNKAIEMSDIDGYITSATLYRELGQYEFSISILEAGYNIHKDTRLLSELVYILCQVEKTIPQARKRYYELKHVSQDPVVPFIVYRGTIENDGELFELEDFMTQHISSGAFVPSLELVQLSKSASKYIFNGMEKENKKLEMIHAKNKEDWTDYDKTENTSSVMRRFYLMQIDIITLGSSRYLGDYLADIQKFGIDGTLDSKDMLQKFFSEHFSKAIEQNIVRRIYNESDGTMYPESHDRIDTTQINKKIRSFHFIESISEHVAGIYALFFHPNFYTFHTEQMTTILHSCYVENAPHRHSTENEEEESQHNLDIQLSVGNNQLNNQFDQFNALPIDVQESYREYIIRFDADYGTFYRRHLQSIIRNPHSSMRKDTDIFTNNPNIALFFCIEELLAGKFGVHSPEEIGKMIKMYNLWDTDISDALLFGTLLYNVSPTNMVEFLMDYQNILHIPQAIYMITKGLCSMSHSQLKNIMKDVIAIMEDNYDTKKFYTYIRDILYHALKNKPSEKETGYIFLANGNISQLQRKPMETILLNFDAAAKFTSEGFIQAGLQLESREQYQEALVYFNKALDQGNTISILTHIISCNIQLGQFDLAEKNIKEARIRGYDIHNYILAFYLWQEKTEEALIQTISIMQQRQKLQDTPEGLLQRLTDTFKGILDLPDIKNEKIIRLKIFASFIRCNFTTDGSVDLKILDTHWKQITNLFDVYKGDELYRIIKISITPLVGEGAIDASDEDEPLSPSIALEYIYLYAMNILQTYDYQEEIAKEDKDRIKIIRQLREQFSIMTIGILAQLSDVEDWHMDPFRETIQFHPVNYTFQSTSFLHPEPETIQ